MVGAAQPVYALLMAVVAAHQNTGQSVACCKERSLCLHGGRLWSKSRVRLLY